MANIDHYIEQIANARYGNEVRSALINALEAMNAEISSSGVSSFNSRTGNVVPAKDDYNISQIASTGGLEGQVPVANSHGGFTMRDIHGEIDMLNQMDDVTISNPTDGQVLKYNNGEWENADESGSTNLVIVSTQTGSGSETATIDISEKSLIYCVLKKGMDIIISKEIPTVALSVGDVISLGTSATVHGKLTANPTLGDNKHFLKRDKSISNDTQIVHTTQYDWGSVSTNDPPIRYKVTGASESNSKFNMALYRNSAGLYAAKAISGSMGDASLNATPSNLGIYADDWQYHYKELDTDGGATNTLYADLSETTSATAKITYSAINTFTLSVTDNNLTLILIA